MKKKKIYNPSDSRKRRYVSSIRNRILAGVVAAVTAATPAVNCISSGSASTSVTELTSTVPLLRTTAVLLK